MTQRLTTTAATGTSDPWTPAAGDILLQAAPQADATGLVVELQGRVNDTAPWTGITPWRPTSEPFVQCVHFPRLRLVWRGNAGQLDIWDAE